VQQRNGVEYRKKKTARIESECLFLLAFQEGRGEEVGIQSSTHVSNWETVFLWFSSLLLVFFMHQ